jgi:IS1 family transposase
MFFGPHAPREQTAQSSVFSHYFKRLERLPKLATSSFLKLKELLAPFGITHFYTDGWGAYRRHLDPAQHTVGKQHTQKIERKHTTLRARIKR